jgi:hypothetical protein
MKQNDVLKVLAKDLGTSDMDEMNQQLKSKTYKEVKYRITSEDFDHYGFTGVIKSITEDGLKVYDVNKVTLIRFKAITAIEKAKPREERPKRAKADVKTAATTTKTPSRPPKDKKKDKEKEEATLEGQPWKRQKPQGSKFIPSSGK